MTQQDFSKFIGQSTATMSSIFNGRTAPSMRIVEAIKKSIPNISYDWLLDGVGPMYVDRAQKVADNESSASDTIKEGSTITQESNPGATVQWGAPQRGANEVGQQYSGVKIVDNVSHRVEKIIILYDNGHWEHFVPEKVVK